MSVIQKLSKKLLLAFSFGIISAASPAVISGIAHANEVVEGFTSKANITPGQIVALENAATKTVKVAPADNASAIYGVAVDPSEAPITLVGQDTKVFVATSGTHQALVSIANGTIKKGDYISMSPINGIAGKARVDQTVILGKAASDFNGSTGVVTSSGGKAIGRIFINIGIQKNPISSTDPTVPAFLRRIANGLADKNVPVIRVYTAVLIFLVSLLAALTVLWSGVRSSLISLGRNPLSRKTIFSGMYKTVFTGLGVFIIGMAGVYLLLKI